NGPFIEEYKGAAQVYGGMTFMSEFNSDNHAEKCDENLYYPFASRDKWELAAFLLQSNLSMESIVKFGECHTTHASFTV
ncbi:hypothetical protein L208DRAFT_1300623, partial [Tricholoma matsutake]